MLISSPKILKRSFTLKLLIEYGQRGEHLHFKVSQGFERQQTYF